MAMRRIVLIFLVIGALAVSGCATLRSEKAFDKAAIGMSKACVIRNVGRPTLVRGIMKNDYCDTVEVWEYRVGCAKHFEQVATEMAFAGMTVGAGAPILLEAAHTDRYWFYFVNGTLAGWGRAGDWARDAAKIRAIKFRPDANLSMMI